MTDLVNALFVPSNPRRPSGVVAIRGLSDPVVAGFLRGEPGTPAKFDPDIGIVLPGQARFRGDDLNERATSWMREHSKNARLFRGEPEDNILQGNALFVGWSMEYTEEQGRDYVMSDVPDRVVHHMLELETAEVVKAHNDRVKRIVEEVERIDPAVRAAEDRSRGDRTQQVEQGGIEL